MIGIMGADRLDDQRFGLFIDLRDKVGFLSDLSFQMPELPDIGFQIFPCLFCCVDGDCDHYNRMYFPDGVNGLDEVMMHIK